MLFIRGRGERLRSYPVSFLHFCTTKYIHQFDMRRIMIVGAGGQLGRCLIEAAAAAEEFRIFAYTRSELDITKPEELRDALQEAKPDVCFNCAAYTAVDRAESEADKADLINHIAAERLAAACEQRGVLFVHFSTDYVYADRFNRPLLESDPTEGIGVYAKTKLLGEQAVLRQQPSSFILRTSWVYSEYGHNFVRTMLRLGQERNQLKVVADQIGSPTYARDLAAAALQLAFDENAAHGIYNYSNSGVCSWYDFALAIHEFANITCNVLPINTSGYPTPAPRPHYSVMDKQKFAALYSPPRHWRLALKACIENIQELV